MNIFKYTILWGILFLIHFSVVAFHIPFQDTTRCQYIGQGMLVLEDIKGNYSLDSVRTSKNFKPYEKGFINLGVSNSVYWIKFKLTNKTRSPILLQVINPLVEEIKLYSITPGRQRRELARGIQHINVTSKKEFSNYVFDLDLNLNETGEYYLRVESTYSIILPMQLGTIDNIRKENNRQDILYAIFGGIMISMIIYNLFLFLTIRDKSYLFYVAYTLSNMFLIFLMGGYGYEHINSFPVHFNLTFYIQSYLNVIFIVLFLQSTIVSEGHPKISKVLKYLLIPYSFSLITALWGYYRLSFTIVNINCVLVGIYFPYILWSISKSGNRPAKILFYAFNGYLIGVLLYGLRNFNILPPNEITNYAMMGGIVFDAFLLSFALGDRINMLKKEKELKQKEIIEHLKINEEYLKLTQELAINSEKFKKEMVAAQFESLKNQVNPHFLFNSLNVLMELVHKNQTNAALFVKELAEIYRYVLKNKDKEKVPLEIELDFIKSYAYLLQIRFGQNLNIEITFKGKRDYMVVPLSLQLLVENCIKHNIITRDEPLSIKIYNNDDYLIISNNLQLKDIMNDSTNIGLKNIQSRYEHLTARTVVIINDGNEFIVKLPLLESYMVNVN